MHQQYPALLEYLGILEYPEHLVLLEYLGILINLEHLANRLYLVYQHRRVE
jgi:hypothetical protein